MAMFARKPMLPYEAAFRNEERKADLFDHYMPKLGSFDDHDLLAELRHWVFTTKKKGRFPYKEGDRAQGYILKMAKMRAWPGAKKLSKEDRVNVEKACIALRGTIVPLFPYREVEPSSRPKKQKLTKKEERRKEVVRDLRQRCFGFYEPEQLAESLSDWEIIQKAASYVGSCVWREKDLAFVILHWEEAYIRGKDRFSFSVANRKEVERILLRVAYADRVLCREQIALFKKGVGLESVPVWSTKFLQQTLL